MTRILAYLPTYAPNVTEAEESCDRPIARLTTEAIAMRINTHGAKSRGRPWVYMDCIDSVINMRPDIELVVGDAKSSDLVREGLSAHHKATGGYHLAYYPEKMSQWALFNDILARHATADTEYMVYTSSDIVWCMDWIAEALREFDKDPTLQIIFPCVNAGDPSIPIQLAPGPRDIGLIDPADHMDCIGMAAARAPCLNAYAFIMRMDFLKTYGGYQTIWLNCFSESFLYYQCLAMGGKLRLSPKMWAYHHSGVDVWVDEGGFYNYIREKPKFDETMDRVQEARAKGEMTIDFLKSVLYV